MNESVTSLELFNSQVEIVNLPPNGRVQYQRRWIESREADRWFKAWSEGLDWQQRPIKLFGREVMQPRLTCLYGDKGVEYRYSGKTLQALPWEGQLERLARKLSSHLECQFNSVLCNLYRDGNDSMGWHADNESELGTNPIIASISLGEQRRFRFKPRDSGSALAMTLDHGSLLVMDGDLQHHWLHELPKSKRAMNPRINLTFRQIN